MVITNLENIFNCVGKYEDVFTMLKYEFEYIKHDQIKTCKCSNIISDKYNFCPICGRPIIHINSSDELEDDYIRKEIIDKIISRKYF